jgi:hypothetical protein
VASEQRTAIPGVPKGVLDAVRTILASSPVPLRRRKILEELERRGHRISLAGLNRVLQLATETGVTVDGPDGVRLLPTDP